MPIYVRPIAEKTVQHVTRDDMLKPDISVQIKVFYQELTKRLDDANFTIDEFDGFVIKDEGSDMPQCYTWNPAYKDDKNTPTET